MKKRILSLLLALVMAVSLLPVNIFADSGETKPTAKINHGYVTGLKFAINGNEVQPSSFETNTPSYDVVLPDTLSTSLFSMTLSEELLAKAAQTSNNIAVMAQDEEGNILGKSGKTVVRNGGANSAILMKFLKSLTLGKQQKVYLSVGVPTADGTSVSDDCDTYELRISRRASASALAVQVDGKTVTTTPSFIAKNSLGGEYSVLLDMTEQQATAADIKLKLTAKTAKDTAIYIGGQKQTTEADSLYPITITAADIKNDAVKVPFSIKYEGNGVAVGTDYCLVIKLKDYSPTITTQPASVTYSKGDTLQPLRVKATVPEGGALSYQWYTGFEATEKNKIEGAVSAIFTPPMDTTYSCSGRYFCRVTNTVGQTTYHTDSEAAIICVNPTTIEPAVISELTGHYTCLAGDPNTVTLSVSESSKDQYGMDAAVCKWYKNTVNSTVGGTLVKEENFKQLPADPTYRSSFMPAAEEPGTYYYYCEVVLTVAKSLGLNTPPAVTTSGIVRIDFEAVADHVNLDGQGTKDAPYQIKTATDLKKLHTWVNKNGWAMSGLYFKMMNDITLPADWTPLGCTKDGSIDIKRGENLHAFSGILDGNGKTLTVPKGGLPLLGYVNGAEVRNLNIYGEEINGYGLVNNFEGVGLSGYAIIMDNVTLKSGSRTLRAGLIGANITTNVFAGVSASYTAIIRNSTIEKDVVVGYDGAQSEIGAFAGRFQGVIENCVSHATVKGVNYVGGIIGTRDNALGDCTIRNCTFDGVVTASGNNAGGIVGGGYNNATAPNGIKINLLGNTVTGAISGKENVGGILGGDIIVAQAWNAYSFKNNIFRGKIKGENNVGGIIGYYCSLNKWDDIFDNVYAADCGADKGIGAVAYVDTSYANPTKADGVLYFNTANGVSGCPKVNGCIWKANHNRTDDPLGKDAVKLCRSTNESLLPDDNGAGTPGNTPATGDTGVLVWIIALPVTALAAAFVLKRKEREA